MSRILFAAFLLIATSVGANAASDLTQSIDSVQKGPIQASGQTDALPQTENMVIAAVGSKRNPAGRTEPRDDTFSRVQPIYNVENMTVQTASRRPTTSQQIRDAIIAGATTKRWQVREIEEGHLVAQIFVRRHMAEVDITYDESSYSITYKDSTNLLYDGTVIHRNYNKWIALMVGQINPVIRSY